MINKSLLSQCHVYIDEELFTSYGKVEFNRSIPYLQTHMIWWNDLNVPYLHFKAYKIIIKGAELKIKVCFVIETK